MVARTIGQLAEEAGVHVETIRYYERRGLLTRPAAPASGYRRYDDDYLWRLGFIRRAKVLGFTLDEVAGLLETDESGQRSPARILAAASGRLSAVEQELAELTVVRARLRTLLERCEDGEADCVTLEPPERAAPTSPPGGESPAAEGSEPGQEGLDPDRGTARTVRS